MNILQILSLILIISVSITHLVFLYLEKELGRTITKGLIVGTIILFAISSKINEPLIYLGLCASLFGDLFLLLKQRRIYFIIGAVLFSITHLLNFVIFFRFLSINLSNWIYPCLYILVGYLLVESFRPLVKEKVGKLSYACIAYLYIVFALVVNSFILLISNFNINLILILIGYGCFLTSDNTIYK